MRTKSGQKGFTLVEVMIVVAIIGILAAVATPMIMASLPRYRLRAVARELMIDFKKAKIEAVKRNRDVLLAFTLETVGNADAGGSYLICVDNNNNGLCDAGEVIMTKNMPDKVRLTGTTFTAPDHVAGYISRGLPWKNQFGAVTLKTSDGTRGYVLTLGPGGRVQMQ
jgi:type IV fimbrial biogenesis protein FimT